MHNISLLPAFAKTLLCTSSDAAIDTFETILDEASEQILISAFPSLAPFAQELPIVKYFVTAGKLVCNVRDQLFLRKTLKFLSDFQKGNVNEKEMQRRRDALDNHEPWIYKELEILIASIEQVNRIEKATILGELYRALVNQIITFSEFDDFCSITEKLFLSDIIQIRSDYETEQQEAENERILKQNSQINFVLFSQKARYIDITGRLLALGLMRISANVGKNLSVNTNLLEYTVTEKGKKYAAILCKINFLGISNTAEV